MRASTERLAKVIALHCVRNTYIEALHGGTVPSSRQGDVTKLRVVVEPIWGNSLEGPE